MAQLIGFLRLMVNKENKVNNRFIGRLELRNYENI